MCQHNLWMIPFSTHFSSTKRVLFLQQETTYSIKNQRELHLWARKPPFSPENFQQCEEPAPTLASINEIGMSQPTKSTSNLPPYTLRTVLKIATNKPSASAQIGKNFTELDSSRGCIDLGWVMLIIGLCILLFVIFVFFSGKLLEAVFEFCDK